MSPFTLFAAQPSAAVGRHSARALPAGETWTPGAVAWTFGQGTGLTVEGTLTASGTTFEADGGTWTGLRADGGTATLTGVTVSDVSHCAFPPFCSYQPERSVVEAVGGATVTLTGGSVIEGGEAANGVLALGKGSTVTVSGASRVENQDGYGVLALDFGQVTVEGSGTEVFQSDAGGVLADGENAYVVVRDRAAVENSSGYGVTATNLGHVTIEPTAQVGNTMVRVNEGGLIATDGGFIDAGDCLLADCDDRGQPNNLSLNDPDGQSPPQDSPIYTRDARSVQGSTVTALYGYWGPNRTTASDLDILNDATSSIYVTPLATSLGGSSLRSTSGGASKSGGETPPQSAVALAAQARRLATRGDADGAWALIAGPLAAVAGDADREALFMAAASLAGDLPQASLARLRGVAESDSDASPWAARVLSLAEGTSYAVRLAALPIATDGHAAFGHRALISESVGRGSESEAQARLAAFEAALGAEPSTTDAARYRAASMLVAAAFEGSGEERSRLSPPGLEKTNSSLGSAAPGLSAAPNPARDHVSVHLRVNKERTGTVDLYDTLGRRVARLHDGPLSEGAQTFEINAAGLAPGVYVVVARTQGNAGATVETLRVTVLR